MPYKLLRFEKEPVKIGDTTKDAFIAVIQEDGVEQPFRVEVENISDQQVALNEVGAWIAAREKEDADRIANAAKDAEDRAKDALLDSLNAGLTQ